MNQLPLLIILPTYMERQNLPEITDSIWESVPNAHLLIVDDASADGTPSWVMSHQNFNRTLFLLERPSKQGLGTAYREGFRWALQRDYQIIMEMDADGSHMPQAIPEFVQKINDGADLVVGSRYVEGIRILNWPFSRLMLSRGAGAYVRLVTGMPLTDPTSGFKAFKRETLQALDLEALHANGYGFQIEVNHMLWKAGKKIVEIPILFQGRYHGSSKMSKEIAREAFWLVLKLAAR